MFEIHKGDPYPEYPAHADRLRWTEGQIDAWEAAGRPHEALVPHIFKTNDRLDAVARGLAWDLNKPLPDLQATHYGHLVTDSAGWPLHPYYRQLLLEGCAVGPGALWFPGTNNAADAVFFHEDGERVLLIRRGDTGIWAPPAGMWDFKRDLENGTVNPVRTALREFAEETGLELAWETTQSDAFFRGMVPDPRMTLFAWIETTAVCFVPDGAYPRGNPVGADDAIAAAYVPLVLLNQLDMNAGHRRFIQQAAKRRGLLS